MKSHSCLKLPFYLLLALCLSCNTAYDSDKASSEELIAIPKQGCVVSAQPLASKVGIDILKSGGNAYDAAIATQFALAVVYPIAGNIGAGGFAIIRTAEGDLDALDFREKAPKAAHRDMFLDEQGEVIPQLSTHGALSAGVPGTVDGMIRLHERYGSLSWQALLDPAIQLAKEGFHITAQQAGNLNEFKPDFDTVNSLPTAFQKEEAWKEGDRLIQPELARSLERISNLGRIGFYMGPVAEAIITTMKAHGGLITQEDLDDYESIWRSPIVGDYKGYHIISMCPPSSGGVALLQLLEGTENFPISDYGPLGSKSIHLMTELERRVYADRATHLGDADFYEVPLDMLLDTLYMDERAADIELDHASPSATISAGILLPAESMQTTHFSIVDKEGNAISLTTTLNGAYGSFLVAEGAGFLLNNQMDDFSIKAGFPNMYGLVGEEANSVQPEKRMLSSMTPTIVERADGSLFMVLGSPGGSTIITSVYQCILDVIEHGMSMQEAVDAPRFHHQWLPDLLYHEQGAFSDSVKKRLETAGHHLQERPPIGKVDAILIDEDGGLHGAADPRGDDRSESY